MPHLPTRGPGRVWAHPCQPRPPQLEAALSSPGLSGPACPARAPRGGEPKASLPSLWAPLSVLSCLLCSPVSVQGVPRWGHRETVPLPPTLTLSPSLGLSPRCPWGSPGIFFPFRSTPGCP